MIFQILIFLSPYNSDIFGQGNVNTSIYTLYINTIKVKSNETAKKKVAKHNTNHYFR